VARQLGAVVEGEVPVGSVNAKAARGRGREDLDAELFRLWRGPAGEVGMAVGDGEE